MPEPDPRFEVPPEYADVYERAFRRVSDAEVDAEDRPGERGAPITPRRRSAAAWAGWIGLLLAVGAAAFLVGQAAGGAGDGAGGGTSTERSAPSRPTPASDTTTPAPTSTPPLRPVAATSTCRQPLVTVEGGRPLSFAPRAAIDDDASTAWACRGLGVGKELVMTLPGPTRISQVGLLPLNQLGGAGLNRIRAVTWTFDDRTSVRQVLSQGARGSVDLQSVPVTTTRTVRMQITDVTQGAADMTGVRSVFLSTP